MKIEKLGIRITELPFEQTIRTEGEDIVIEDPLNGTARRYSVESATALRDALTLALMSHLQAHGPRSWNRLEDVPAEVGVVSDVEGDHWHRNQNAPWVNETGDYAGPVTDKKYGPFSEIPA